MPPSTLSLVTTAGLEEAERLGAVADQEVLGLRVVLEHHLVVLPPHPGDLVATEGGSGGVEVVTVGPHPTRLDGPTHSVGEVAVASPHTRTQSVEGVVGDAHGVGLVGEGGHGEDGPEDLLLEDTHVVAALEHGGLEVVATFELSAQMSRARRR